MNLKTLLMRVNQGFAPLLDVVGRPFRRFRLLFVDHYLLEIPTIKDHYSDPRNVILHAVMNQAVVMHDDPWYSQIDWLTEPHHAKTYYAVEKAYNHWTRRVPARYDPMDNYNGETFTDSPVDPDTGFCRITFSEEFKKVCEVANIYDKMYEEEDQKILEEIVKLRMGLWC